MLASSYLQHQNIVVIAVLPEALRHRRGKVYVCPHAPGKLGLQAFTEKEHPPSDCLNIRSDKRTALPYQFSNAFTIRHGSPHTAIPLAFLCILVRGYAGALFYHGQLSAPKCAHGKQVI
jgi:hypothetical protein